MIGVSLLAVAQLIVRAHQHVHENMSFALCSHVFRNLQAVAQPCTVQALYVDFSAESGHPDDCSRNHQPSPAQTARRGPRTRAGSAACAAERLVPDVPVRGAVAARQRRQ